MLKGEIWWAVLPRARGSEHAPGNFRLEKGVSKLEKSSVVNFSQIVTIDKTFIREYVCALPKSFLERIDQSLKTVFDIQF